MSRDECHRFLNDWITNYVTEDDSASSEVKAKKPLREARIDVEEIPGRPGASSRGGFPATPLPVGSVGSDAQPRRRVTGGQRDVTAERVCR